MTIGYDVTVEGLEEQLRKLADYDGITNRHLRTSMQQSLLTIGANVIPLVPVGVSGRLRNSMGSEIKELDGSLIGRFGSSLKDETYPQVMEFGRGPGSYPEMNQLLRWVHLKIRPGEAREASVTFMIARAIFEHGIKGRYFMKQGFDKAKTAVIGYFNQALDRIARDLTNGR